MTLPNPLTGSMTKVPRNRARTRAVHAVTVCVDASLRS